MHYAVMTNDRARYLHEGSSSTVGVSIFYL
jgi:hypothetical protein